MDFTYNITFSVNDKNRIACIKSETIGAITVIELLFKFQIMLIRIIHELHEMEINDIKPKSLDDDIPF